MRAVSNRETSSTGTSVVVRLVHSSMCFRSRARFSSMYMCPSVLSRRIFQRLALPFSVFVVSSAIIVSVKPINVVFRVEIIIITIAIRNHPCALTLSFSTFSADSDSCDGGSSMHLVSLGTSNISERNDSISMASAHRRKPKNNRAVCRVCPSRYVLFSSSIAKISNANSLALSLFLQRSNISTSHGVGKLLFIVTY